MEADLGSLMGLFNEFIPPVTDSIPSSEFQSHFFNSVELSASSSDALQATNFKSMNEEFTKKNIPYMLFQESKKTNLPAVGKSYYFATPEEVRIGQ